MGMPETIKLDHPDNLHLLRLGPDDAEVIRAYVNSNTIDDPRWEAREMSEWRSRHIVESLTEAMRRDERAYYTIRDPENTMVGEVELYEHRNEFAEVQFSVADHLRRRGIARAAVGALVEQGQQHWGITRLGLVIAEDNTASQAFARSMGAAYIPGFDRVSDDDVDGVFAMQSWEKML